MIDTFINYIDAADPSDPIGTAYRRRIVITFDLPPHLNKLDTPQVMLRRLPKTMEELLLVPPKDQE